MNAFRGLIAVLGIALLAAATAWLNLSRVLVVIPYLAFVFFLVGFSYRILLWAGSPVPFRITTTCGQQKSLPWIKHAPLENPSTGWGVLGRMFLEVFLFRSLSRNSRARLRDGKVSFRPDQWLWLGAWAFHWSLLVILLRHLRFFLQPIPAMVNRIERIDGFLQIGFPHVYLSDLVIVCALTYLIKRRLHDPLLRFVSLFSDYFVLVLLGGIVLSGLLMRFAFRDDLLAVKQFALSLAALRPHVPTSVSPLFVIHLMLVSTLVAYFPASKLVHMAGVFLSPTRNLANNNRAKRHFNPWNAPVVSRSYADWEHDFQNKLRAAAIPLEVKDAGKAVTD
ncbi:DsrM [Candidatus Sulfotelmatobacter kueseliae]|uniref:DsrM n=1 Tax=Candidatus Sulfotelmatobacter kueseliae TaxID=2042962 RepID=A0A2U3JXU7_9BACT|nr:DsrM [Candidatus Sulfotelmatobacter kueseliae]